MILTIGIGIGEIRFGMRESEVIRILGNPSNIKYELDSPNRKYLEYYDLELRISIFENYNNVVGYISTSNPKIEFNGHLLKDMNISKFIYKVSNLKFKWVLNEYHSFDIYSLDQFCLSIQTEFKKIKILELGALINEEDEYVFNESNAIDILRTWTNSLEEAATVMVEID